MHLGAFAQGGAEPAGAAQPGQPAGARPGDHEPVAADDVVPDGPARLRNSGLITFREARFGARQIQIADSARVPKRNG